MRSGHGSVASASVFTSEFLHKDLTNLTLCVCLGVHQLRAQLTSSTGKLLSTDPSLDRGVGKTA